MMVDYVMLVLDNNYRFGRDARSVEAVPPDTHVADVQVQGRISQNLPDIHSNSEMVSAQGLAE